MSERREKKRRVKLANSKPAKRGYPKSKGILLAAAIVVALGFWWWKYRPAGIFPGANPIASESAVGFQKLTGRWQRLDGGYVLEIKNIGAQGVMDAAYFNPRSIHVEKAKASQDGDGTKIFIELRDVNYPGSTYSLTYDAANDRLQGIYYQAVERLRFEVAFMRMK